MSTDAVPTTSGTSGQSEAAPAPVMRRQSSTLARAIARYRNDAEIEAEDTSPLADVDLDALDSGALTFSEIRRIEGIQILEMLKRGKSLPEIKRILHLSSNQVNRLLHRQLTDLIGEVDTDVLRAIQYARYEWSVEFATNMLRKTEDPEWMRARNESLVKEDKLYGLPMPEKVEVKETKHVEIELHVRTERVELPSPAFAPPSQIAFEPGLPAEAATDVEIDNETEVADGPDGQCRE